MIDEKKLIEDIEKEFDGVCVYDVSPSRVVADFVEIVDRQPIVGEWIPCSEGLPKDKQEVQITDSQGRVRQIIFNKWLFENSQYSHGIKMLAWMPLPEPYKGE